MRKPESRPNGCGSGHSGCPVTSTGAAFLQSDYPLFTLNSKTYLKPSFLETYMPIAEFGKVEVDIVYCVS